MNLSFAAHGFNKDYRLAAPMENYMSLLHSHFLALSISGTSEAPYDDLNHLYAPLTLSDSLTSEASIENLAFHVSHAF